jgi:hypothetical protein
MCEIHGIFSSPITQKNEKMESVKDKMCRRQNNKNTWQSCILERKQYF